MHNGKKRCAGGEGGIRKQSLTIWLIGWQTHKVDHQPELQQVAPAVHEGVTWSVGQVKESRPSLSHVIVGTFFSSSALPRSSGTRTVKPRGLCTSERPEEEGGRSEGCSYDFTQTHLIKRSKIQFWWMHWKKKISQNERSLWDEQQKSLPGHRTLHHLHE